MRRLPILISLALATAMLHAVEAAKPKSDLARLTKVYNDQLGRIEAKYAEQEKGWRAEYVKALRTFQQQMQEAGNLDGLVAAKKEIDRFQLAGTISDADLAVVSAELAALQMRYRDMGNEHSVDEAEETIALSEKYTEHLGSLRVSLTKAGKIELALAVDKEMKRVEGSPQVASARFVLADSQVAEISADEGEADGPAEKEVGNGEGAAPEVAERSSTPMYKTHHGKPPSLSGVHFKKLVLRPTPEARLKRKASVTAVLGSGSLRFLRLGLRSGSMNRELENLRVVVQYFRKSGNSPPQETSVNYAIIGRLGRETVTIDFLRQYRSYSYSSSYYYSTTSLGSDFYGAIVTVFDSDDSIACQGATSTALEPMAHSANSVLERVKHMAVVTEARQASEAARRAYDAARESYYGNTRNAKLRAAYDKARAAYETAQSRYYETRRRGVSP